VTLVDTNVLLDVFTDDPHWAAWSLAQMDRVSLLGPLAINDVIYAELSVRFDQIETLDDVVGAAMLVVERTPPVALFLAGKAFQRYRAVGGIRTGVLPDFFIGAHAAVSGYPLLTRDARPYRTYFPGVEIIAP